MPRQPRMFREVAIDRGKILEEHDIGTGKGQFAHERFRRRVGFQFHR